MPRLPRALRPWWRHFKVAYTVTTRILGPATRAVSGLRASRALPRRVAVTAEEAKEASPDSAQLCVVWPAETLRRSVPEGLPPAHWRFRDNLTARIPRAFVLELVDGRVAGSYGAVITSNNVLASEVSPYFGISSPWDHPIFLRPWLPAVEAFPGRLAVLATRGANNYCHFLLDVLPRLQLIAGSRGLERPDAFFVPTGHTFQRELLAAFGLSSHQLVDSSVYRHIQAASLVAPCLPDTNLQTPPWVVQYLRQRLLPDAESGARRRLYLTRGHQRQTRRIVNEEEVLALVEHHGFECIDPGAMTVEAQIRAFRDAEVVIGVHGAGMANLVFASPGTRVVELFSPDYVNVCYWALTQALEGVEYRYLVGEGRPHRSRERAMKGVSTDVVVDLTKLASLLR